MTCHLGGDVAKDEPRGLGGRDLKRERVERSAETMGRDALADPDDRGDTACFGPS